MSMRRYTPPSIAVIGGGTGLSTMLRGLKFKTSRITAIVTVTDDGGGSGVLRRELGMPPPGDIRSCILALANAEPAMEDMMNYRFREGSLAGQSLGNLVLAALNDMSPTFDQAVTAMGQVLAITGQVLPVTNENLVLQAEFTDGAVIRGETRITDYKRHTDAVIRRISLDPAEPAAIPAVLEAIRRADMIVLGPGSLFTSVIPNLLTKGVAEAVCASGAVKVYVMNIMTQNGETERYTAAGHARALLEHGGPGLFDYILLNSRPVDAGVLAPYEAEGANQVEVDEEALLRLGVEPVYAPVASWTGGLIRHDPAALADALMRLYHDKAETRTAFI